MLTIKDLADTLGLSDPQVRRRIDALEGVIEDHIKRGKKSKLKVDSGGLELLRRLEALREEGATIKEAAGEIKDELGSSETKKTLTETTPDKANQREGKREGSDKNELIEELRSRVRDLQEDKRELRKQLERKDNRIQQLLPSAKGEKERESSEKDEFKEMGFFQLVKRWLTTKA